MCFGVHISKYANIYCTIKGTKLLLKHKETLLNSSIYLSILSVGKCCSAESETFECLTSENLSDN